MLFVRKNTPLNICFFSESDSGIPEKEYINLYLIELKWSFWKALPPDKGKIVENSFLHLSKSTIWSLFVESIRKSSLRSKLYFFTQSFESKFDLWDPYVEIHLDVSTTRLDLSNPQVFQVDAEKWFKLIESIPFSIRVNSVA